MMKKEDHHGIVENIDARAAEESLDSHWKEEPGVAA
jgi:hypothetical protein